MSSFVKFYESAGVIGKLPMGVFRSSDNELAFAIAPKNSYEDYRKH